MKKILTLLTALTLCVGCTAQSAEVLTEDSAEVKTAVDAGVLLGTGEGYELERDVTRAEALTFIERISDADGGTAAGEPVFNDTEGHWAYDTIQRFAAAGYINGVGNGAYEPDRTVTAREFMKIYLSVQNGGSDGITIENVFDKAVEAGYLIGDVEKTLVSENAVMTRSDTVRLCTDIMAAETDGSFAAKMAAKMPNDVNYMVSPFSVQTAFAMVANGAKGETREQLLDALEIDDLDAYNSALAADIERYGSDTVMTVDINNSLWLLEDMSDREYLEPYEKDMSKYYFADTFRLGSDVAMDEMNRWVGEKTHGKINRIFDKMTYDELLKNDLFSVLINAVYFKAGWQNEFSPAATDKDIFTDINGNETETDFMHDTGYYAYYDDGDMQIIELPYRRYDGENESALNISMYAVKGSYTYSKAEKAIENGLANRRIQLSFPKFKTEFETGILNMMIDFGAWYMADGLYADLGNMYSGETGPYAKRNPYICYAKHKTFIEVDEEGTEAAAVTWIGGGTTSVITEPPLEVKYDTPFMYIIRDNDTGETLFFGEQVRFDE